MKKITKLIVIFLMFVGLLASSGGASAQGQSGQWGVVYEMRADQFQHAQATRAQLTDALQAQGAAVKLEAGTLELSGTRGLEQMRSALFDGTAGWADFLGSPAELTVTLPAGSMSATLKLEARNTTGYRWIVADVANFAQQGESTFVMRYRGIGVPSIQTIQLKRVGSGNTVRLTYLRLFEKDAPIRVSATLWAESDTIELSDPTPVMPKEEMQSVQLPQGTLPYRATLPASYDARTLGIVPAVRNQGGCGSCWSFGTTGMMEIAIKKGGGPMTDLSEQFLISCNKDYWGCDGGLTASKYYYNTLAIAQTAAGAVLESAKPYRGTKDTCAVAYAHPYKASGWQFLTGSEWTMPTNDQIKNAIMTYGAVTAGVCADSGWGTYTGGVYNPTYNECGGGTNHQIVLVGWNDSTQSWILRNSWGAGWGESGYMRIRYNPAGNTSRVGEGASWIKYGSAPVSSFNSSFNGSASGWSAVKGAWSVYNAMYYRSTGVPGFASAKHTGSYTNFTYEVKMKRTGTCTGCANDIVVRGNPVSLDPNYYWWRPSYLFGYTNNGTFAVLKVDGAGASTALKGWTTSATIVKNGWNTLKVVAGGTSLKFYINNTLVWAGTDASFASGNVGFGFYRDAYAGTLDVDSAILTVPSAAPSNSVEEVAPGVEVPGGSIYQSP